MKIGILTMYYRRNYGGILQSYALFRILNNLGHDVEIIDFRYNSKGNIHPVSRITALLGRFRKSDRSNVKSIATRELPPEHIKAFSNFKAEYLKYSTTVDNNTLGGLASKYDAIVVGSDQVWNGVSDRKLFYFYDWKPIYKGLKIAYAPCSVNAKVPWYNKNKIKHLLKGIDFISARDETTALMVDGVIGQKPQIVLDPTGLYDFKEFIEESIIKEDYIFAYILGSEVACGHQTIISKIREKYGNMKVVAALIPNISLEVEKFADDIRYNASPLEWVNYVAHSKFVYTDSFHGCMFAMKYHKPFFAYYKDSRRVSRLKDLKETYHMDNIQASGQCCSIMSVDYDFVDNIIKIQREESLNYLKKSLNKNK